jgi:hypothetical protein
VLISPVFMQSATSCRSYRARHVEYWARAVHPGSFVAMAALQDMVRRCAAAPVAVLGRWIGSVALCACVSRSSTAANTAPEATPAPILHDNPLLTEAE